MASKALVTPLTVAVIEQSGGALPVPYVAASAFSTTAPNCVVATSARTSFASPRVWSVTVRRILVLETSLWLGVADGLRDPSALAAMAVLVFEGWRESWIVPTDE